MTVWILGLMLGGLLALTSPVQAQCKACDRCTPDKLVPMIAGLLTEARAGGLLTGTLPISQGGPGGEVFYSGTSFNEKKSDKLRREAKEKQEEAERLDRRDLLLEEAKKVLRDCQ